MESQFRFYAKKNIPLLAFKGDVSIRPKWDAAMRLYNRWAQAPKPITVLYYGDLDPKGLDIPDAAHRDVVSFSAILSYMHTQDEARYVPFFEDFEFVRVGINPEHVARFNIPENPDRPGTYQWEGLDDAAAQELIGLADSYVNEAAFEDVAALEERITGEVRARLAGLRVEE